MYMTKMAAACNESQGSICTASLKALKIIFFNKDAHQMMNRCRVHCHIVKDC